MAKRRLLAILCLLCLLPCRALAVSTADASQPIDPAASCTLTIRYAYDQVTFSELPVQLYQVARVSADFRYTLTEDFAPTGLELNGIETTGEWDVIRSTLEAHIVGSATTPAETAPTDAAGQAVFADLQPGLYFAVVPPVIRAEGTYLFHTALVAVPGLDPEGNWQYQVAVNAKAQFLPPVEPEETIEYKVLKLWKGDKNINQRPKSVQVEIFCNGESRETVTLSEETQWAYSWQAKDDGSVWKVVERNIPENYTVTVEDRQTTFVLTNTYEDPDNPKPPETGDTTNVMLYIVLMSISGIALILLGIAGKKKRL